MIAVATGAGMGVMVVVVEIVMDNASVVVLPPVVKLVVVVALVGVRDAMLIVRGLAMAVREHVVRLARVIAMELVLDAEAVAGLLAVQAVLTIVSLLVLIIVRLFVLEVVERPVQEHVLVHAPHRVDRRVAGVGPFVPDHVQTPVLHIVQPPQDMELYNG